MIGLLWLRGIGWSTQVNDIGWTWVVLAVLIGCLVYGLTKLIHLLREDDWRL